ncbi:hypothetical protein EJB05_39492, partial [Eragrostis curvula]
MEKAAGEDETVEARETAAAPIAGAPAAKKRKEGSGAMVGPPGAGICDDVLRNIFARLPARDAVACMALSKHHCNLICSTEFRSLHCRLGAPLPRPHIAYIVTVPVRRRPEQEDAVGQFYGFHVAGAGLRDHAPVRAIAGSRYLGKKYINNCNGIVLLADEEFSVTCSCILWNPAIADAAKEVTIPDQSPEREYRVLGLGYGRRSKTYKILLCRKQTHWICNREHTNRKGRCTCGDAIHIEYSLATYTVGDKENQPQLRTVLSDNMDAWIGHESLYMDGTSYLLHVEKLLILAVHVDDETVTTIDLPGESKLGRTVLMELYGRPCMFMYDGTRYTLWLLSLDHQWEQRFVTNDKSCASVAGIWDCSGLLLIYFNDAWYNGKVCLYNVATEKMLEANLPSDMELDWSNYAICWGYRPTLVSPESIVGVVNQGKERRRDRSAGILHKLKPINEQDKRKGQEEMLDTVCFMEFLVGIMQKLPDDLQDVVEMSLMDAEGALNTGYYTDLLVNDVEESHDLSYSL